MAAIIVEDRFGWTPRQLLAKIEEDYGPGIAAVCERFIFDPKPPPKPRKSKPKDSTIVQFPPSGYIR